MRPLHNAVGQFKPVAMCNGVLEVSSVTASEPGSRRSISLRDGPVGVSRAESRGKCGKFNASETSIVTQVGQRGGKVPMTSPGSAVNRRGRQPWRAAHRHPAGQPGAARGAVLTNPVVRCAASHWWQPACGALRNRRRRHVRGRFLLAAMPIYSRESSMVGMTTALWLFSRTAAA